MEVLYAETLPETSRDKGLVYDRNTNNELGYDDDAMLVTEELYDAS